MTISMSYDDFVASIRGIAPEAQFETDNDGQVIIYTNKQKDDLHGDGFHDRFEGTEGIIPEAQFETDNDGQVIIYTNKQKSDFTEKETNR
jgi:hypothetical protein